MKLRNLKSAVRKHTGTVTIELPTPLGPMVAGLVKGELIAALDERYGGDGMTETGITLENGNLCQDPEHPDMWANARLPVGWSTGKGATDPDQIDIEELIAATSEPSVDDLLNL